MKTQTPEESLNPSADQFPELQTSQHFRTDSSQRLMEDRQENCHKFSYRQTGDDDEGTPRFQKFKEEIRKEREHDRVLQHRLKLNKDLELGKIFKELEREQEAERQNILRMQPFLTDEEMEEMLRQQEQGIPEFYSEEEYNQYYAELYLQSQLEEQGRLEPLSAEDIKELDELYEEFQRQAEIDRLHGRVRSTGTFRYKPTKMEAE